MGRALTQEDDTGSFGLGQGGSGRTGDQIRSDCHCPVEWS